MTHAIMFHHFQDDIHLPAQGSLSTDDFVRMITWLKSRFDILDAHEYADKFLSDALKDTDICLSFDDALRCQYDIAMPVLEEHNINAFFFVYSSAFSGTPDFLEIFRYFRTTEFDGVDGFYNHFFDNLIQKDEVEYFSHQRQYESLNYLSAFPFYTEHDKWFRYLRDQYLGTEKYNDVMFELMSEKQFDIGEAKQVLWMTENQLVAIYQKGHTVGLHSYSHPMQMSKLPRNKQLMEYEQNLAHLSRILKSSEITSMSHPCGDYSSDTLSILQGMGIKIGFRSNMGVKEIRCPLEISREDHANVFKEMQQ